jgi:hypothetical protein
MLQHTDSTHAHDHVATCLSSLQRNLNRTLRIVAAPLLLLLVLFMWPRPVGGFVPPPALPRSEGCVG